MVVDRSTARPDSALAGSGPDLGKTIVSAMDASLVIAHSDKELAAGTYKAPGDTIRWRSGVTTPVSRWHLLLRKGSAGSNTVADHLEVLTQAITGIPARYRRDLLITVDGGGASHGLIDHITTLGAAPWRTVHYSIGWALDTRERTAIGLIPACAWGTVLDGKGQPRDRDEAGVVEVTALLRHGSHGDHLANWPADLRIISPPRKAPPRRAAVLVRTQRRLALPAPGLQHPRQDHPVPRSPPPTTRPGRGLHPHRQGHRPGPSALDLDRNHPDPWNPAPTRGDNRAPA
ncbi:MAG: hypothetical protein ACRDTA_14735 [Pseudonocardiaceae bacterium]